MSSSVSQKMPESKRFLVAVSNASLLRCWLAHVVERRWALIVGLLVECATRLLSFIESLLVLYLSRLLSLIAALVRAYLMRSCRFLRKRLASEGCCSCCVESLMAELVCSGMSSFSPDGVWCGVIFEIFVLRSCLLAGGLVLRKKMIRVYESCSCEDVCRRVRFLGGFYKTQCRYRKWTCDRPHTRRPTTAEDS